MFVINANLARVNKVFITYTISEHGFFRLVINDISGLDNVSVVACFVERDSTRFFQDSGVAYNWWN